MQDQNAALTASLPFLASVSAPTAWLWQRHRGNNTLQPRRPVVHNAQREFPYLAFPAYGVQLQQVYRTAFCVCICIYLSLVSGSVRRQLRAPAKPLSALFKTVEKPPMAGRSSHSAALCLGTYCLRGSTSQAPLPRPLGLHPPRPALQRPT